MFRPFLTFSLVLSFFLGSPSYALSLDSLYGLKSFPFPTSVNSVNKEAHRINNYSLTTTREGNTLFQYCYRNGNTYRVYGKGFNTLGEPLGDWIINSSTDYASGFSQCFVKTVSKTELTRSTTAAGYLLSDNYYSLLHDAIQVPVVNINTIETYLGLIKINSFDMSVDTGFLSIRPLDPTDSSNFEYTPVIFSSFQDTSSYPDLVIQSQGYLAGIGERLELVDVNTGFAEAIVSVKLFDLTYQSVSNKWNNLTLAEMAVASPSIKIDRGGVRDNFPSDYSNSSSIGPSLGTSTARVRDTQVDRYGNVFVFTEHNHRKEECYFSDTNNCVVDALNAKEIYKLNKDTGEPTLYLDGYLITQALGGDISGYDLGAQSALTANIIAGRLVGFNLSGFFILDDFIFVMGRELTYVPAYSDIDADYPPEVIEGGLKMLSFSINDVIKTSLDLNLSSMLTQVSRLNNGDYLFLNEGNQLMHFSPSGIEQSPAISLPMTATHFIAHSMTNVQVFGLGPNSDLIQLKVNTGLQNIDVTPVEPTFKQMGKVDVLLSTDGQSFNYKSRSNVTTISGLDTGVRVPAYVINGEISVNNGEFVSGRVDVSNGDSVQLQQTIGYGHDVEIEVQSIAVDGYSDYVYITALVMGGGLTDEGRNQFSIGSGSITTLWTVPSSLYARAEAESVNSGSVDTSLLAAGAVIGVAIYDTLNPQSGIGGFDEPFLIILLIVFLSYAYKTRK